MSKPLPPGPPRTWTRLDRSVPARPLPSQRWHRSVMVFRLGKFLCFGLVHHHPSPIFAGAIPIGIPLRWPTSLQPHLHCCYCWRQSRSTGSARACQPSSQPTNKCHGQILLVQPTRIKKYSDQQHFRLRPMNRNCCKYRMESVRSSNLPKYTHLHCTRLASQEAQRTDLMGWNHIPLKGTLAQCSHVGRLRDRAVTLLFDVCRTDPTNGFV